MADKIKALSDVKKAKWKNLKKRVVGMTVIKKDNKPFLLMVVKLPQKGKGFDFLPLFIKRGLVKTARSAVNYAPNIATFGIAITANLVQDMAKYYSATTKKENLNKSPLVIFKETFPEYQNSYEFWNKYITNPLLASLAIGAVSGITKSPKLIDPSTEELQKVIKQNAEKLRKTFNLTDVKLDISKAKK